jgi:cyclopropane-fatty-acyl-phospholipid synthase
MIANPALAAGVSYAEGDWCVVEGDLADIIAALRGDIQLPAPVPLKVLNFGQKTIDGFLGRKSDLKNIDFHYSIGNEFYELWLDSEMFYSCAYYQNQTDSLEIAQQAKARRIAAKLNLRPGDRVLDIGCGWGGMAFYLARNFDVRVTGISLAKCQVDYANARAVKLGLADRTRFDLCDYRSAEGRFDAIVSIGMLEHVGKAHLTDMFKAVDRLLKPDGVALVHTIGSVRKNPRPNPWIDRYIFPGGYIPSLIQITTAIEQTSLLVTDVETLRMHYAWTLNAWRLRFADAKRKITSMFGERFFRVWDFYLALSEASFRAGIYVNYQVQLTKGIDSLPFTRDYMNLESHERKS